MRKIINIVENAMTSRVESLPAFKSWFSGSKAVDDQGKPLILYHATNADFERFGLGNGNAQSHAFFFAPVENELYMDMYLDSFSIEGQNFIPVFLSIKRPKIVHTDYENDDVSQWADPDFENAEISRAKREGYDGIIFRDISAGTTFYAVFKPEQIKSAMNRGTFDNTSNIST